MLWRKMISKKFFIDKLIFQESGAINIKDIMANSTHFLRLIFLYLSDADDYTFSLLKKLILS